MGCNCGGSRWTPAGQDAQAQPGQTPVTDSAYFWGGPAQPAQPDPADTPAQGVVEGEA